MISILSQDRGQIVKVESVVLIEYDDCFSIQYETKLKNFFKTRIVTCNVGFYELKEDAEKVLILIASAIEQKNPLFIMPFDDPISIKKCLFRYGDRVIERNNDNVDIKSE